MSKLRNFDWRLEAQYLLDVKNKEKWRDEQANSFSHWLKLRAENDGVKISLLWRYLRTGRFAIELNVGNWKKVTLPMHIPLCANADSIELLEKINRVAADEDFNVLAEDLYAGRIKRPQLLKLWQIYREAMPEGKTARGRGKSRPVLTDQGAQDQLSFQQRALSRLSSISPTELGYADHVTLRIIQPMSERQKQLGYSAIMLATEASRVVDVALIVFGHEMATAIAHLKDERAWLILPPNIKNDYFKSIADSHTLEGQPFKWGLIVYQDGDLKKLNSISTSPAVIPFVDTSLAIPLAISELLINMH